jgi:hypothetical protein
LFTPICHVAVAQSPNTIHQAAQGVLSREQAAAILPQSVFFRGQSASLQGRNSSGIRFANGKFVLMALVDTSGYSSALQQTYQAYLITEVPLILGGQTLNPGAYGFGFVADNKMTLMDIGGNEILHTTTTHDQALARPTPLQILPDAATGAFRLYLGRSYVALAPAEK